MSIYPNVTEKDLENLRKLADQQKEQQALKNKNRILKKTHDVKLAESLSPITKKLDQVNKSTRESLSPITQKLDNINESTQKVGDLIESNSKKELSTLLKNTFKSLKETSSSLKLNDDEEGNLTILGTLIKSLGGDKILVNNRNIYEVTPEIHRALSKSSYTGKSMKDEDDRKNLYNLLTDIGYSGYGDQKNSQKIFFIRLLNQ